MRLTYKLPQKFRVIKFTVEKVYGMSVFILYIQAQLQKFVIKPFFPE